MEISQKKPPVDQALEQRAIGRRVTVVGLVVNVFLTAFKLFAGWLGQSQALIADAVHSLSDLFTDAVVLVGLRVGRRDPDPGHPFGHGRLETVAASVVGLGLLAVALYLGVGAGLGIYRHVEHRPNWLALLGAAVSIALKEALYQYTIRAGRRIRSSAVVANAWHHRSDAFSSVAVLLGVGGAQIRPEWHILDAFATLVVALLILGVGYDILKASVSEFTDAAPAPEVMERIRSCAGSVAGVQGVHDLRVRTSGGLYQMELHIVVAGGLPVREGHAIAKQVESCVHQELQAVGKLIIHVDPGPTD